MYFFDTYALFEDLYGNKNYEKYKHFPFKIGLLNIAEFYAGLLKEYGKETAVEIYSKFEFDILEITEGIILEAVEFRRKYKKQKLSLADAVGYLLAKKYGLKFLTGDKKFENFPDVEFVKK